jgi:hypothetical protein
LALHPINRLDLPFRLLTGLVDSDRFSQVGIFFPALWTEPGFVGVLPRGTPVAQCIPLRREEPELDFRTLTEDEAAAQVALTREILEQPGVYKSRFRAKRRR